MTIARAQMYRQLYQMGGIGSLPMDFGQPLEVPQQMPTNFSSAQNITMNPLLNYGQPQLGQAGGTPLTMAGGGITRLGYQEGGMDQMMMEPQMQDQAMMQPQMQQAPEGIMNAMPQEAGGAQQGQSEEKGTMSLAVIIKLLMDQGIDPETAKQLAIQILQAFAQGGESAVDEFANQLEQQEGMQEMAMMANGGIMSYAQRQNYGLGKIVKSIGKAVKSVAKSDIGKIALTVAAVYFGGPMLAGSLGVSAATGAAIAGGLANSALQLASGKKFNPLEALISAGGAYAGAGGFSSGAPTTSIPGAEELLKSGVATPTEVFTSPGTLSSGVTGATSSPTNYFSPMESQFAGQGQYSAPATPPSMPQPNLIDKGIMSARQAGQYLSETGTNFMQDPIATLGRGLTNVKDFAGENKEATLAAATFGLNALAQQPGESDDEYSSRAARDPQVAAYITRYGGGIGLRSSPFYQMEKAVDPFAGTSLATSTNPFYPQGYSMGGRIGYAEGSTSFERQTLEKKGYGDMMKNMTPREISQLYDSVMGTFSRRFQAEGTMPMGEPRKNPAGIMELDYRAKGGFVPPVGIKEKADDIPAMLSNNEFVFTADAVRNAGGGNVNKGAQRMYGLMKQLEAGGRV